MSEPTSHTYLGDGVYAYWDGYHVWLRLHHHNNTVGQIKLKPPVMAALDRYAKERYAEAIKGKKDD